MITYQKSNKVFVEKSFIPSFTAFKNKIKIKIKFNAKLTFHPYKICQVSTNIKFNLIYESWETGY
jgi:hypothetical protein